jgi:hypothetical protein
MIIGVNGKIGSGKDTVGKIIQWLTKPEPDGQYIGFQTYDDYTLEKLSPFKIKKFAGKLKQIASLLTGVSVEKFEDQEFKKLDMNPEWEMTYREFLQKLGTEAMRDGLHTNVWVNALFADYNATGYNYTGCENKVIQGEWEYPNWIITDMRFPNEMEAVVERKGITIRVVRSFNHKMGSKETGTLDLTPLHPSETALDDAEFNYTIINDGTIENLVEKVREILIKENII